MTPLRLRDLAAEPEPQSHRRRGFGLDSPLPADRRIILRAVLRHLAEERPTVVVFGLAGAKLKPDAGATRDAVGGPDLLLLAPGGRSVFVTVKPQAIDLTRAHRAFADLCRSCAVPARGGAQPPRSPPRLRPPAPVTETRGLMRSRKAISLSGAGRTQQDATPERLRHATARGIARVDSEGVRRLGDPFDALHSRNLLDREDPDANARLWQAGDRLRGHWHLARLDPLTAFDFRRESVDGGRASPGSPAEGALKHRDALRAAQAAIGPRLLPYLVGLVIDARTVAELRPLVTDTGHARTADALVIERLREGLHRLCEHWGMDRDVRPRPRLRAWQAPEAP